MLMQVKRKRIAELSVRTLPSQIDRKSQWGFVLEEMTWLANDFAQVIFSRPTFDSMLYHHYKDLRIMDPCYI